MELKSQDTKMIQGLSILAMICLHLFCKDYHDIFEPLIFVGDIPLSFYFAQLSDFCVMGFAFCSGYGHMAQSEKEGYYKTSLKRVVVLLMNYWIVLIVFSIVSIIVGNGNDMPKNIWEFILNFLTLKNSYNGAWWYMFTYIVLVFISPWIITCVKKYNVFLVLTISLMVYCVAFYIRFYMGYTNWVFEKIGPFGMTFFEYVLGCVFFEYSLFSWANKQWNKIRERWKTLLSVILFLMLLYGRTKIVPNFFVAPISGMSLIMLFHFWQKPSMIRRMFLFFGKHSTNLWLTHMFFYSTLFVNFVYIVRYPVFVYIFMVVLTIGVSYLLQLLQRPITAKLQERMQV